MPSGQNYAHRLREEMRKALAQQIRTFEDEFRTLETDFARSISKLTQRLAAIRAIEVPAVDTMLGEAVRQSVQSEVRRRDEDLLRLAHFAHDLRQKETQHEILSALLDEAARHAPRLVLFATRGSQFVGWAARGLTEAATRKLSGSALAFDGSDLLRNALNADGLTTTNDLSREKILAELLPAGLPGPWHAFPLKAIQRPVAVLLASAAEGTGCDLEPLCILMDLTGLCIENIALKILQEEKVARAAAESHPLPAVPAKAEPPAPKPTAPVTESAAVEIPSTFGPPPVPESPAIVTPLPPEPAAPAEAAESAIPAAEPAEAPLAAAVESPEQAEVAGSAEALPSPMPAAEPPEVEAPAAAAAAPAVTGEKEAGESGPAEPGRAPVLREVQPLTEEEKLHADAKRFARLLASEIKLYNEDRVREGRAKKDLYVRLKRDIDRSREMYDKRVSSVVTKKADYFHDELLRILAENDPAILGAEYPGPRIGA